MNSSSNLKERFQDLSLKLQKLDYKEDNVLKRKLYAESELLRMDIEQNTTFAQGVEGLRIKNELGKSDFMICWMRSFDYQQLALHS
jgi:hypothetical protein